MHVPAAPPAQVPRSTLGMTACLAIRSRCVKYGLETRRVAPPEAAMGECIRTRAARRSNQRSRP